MWALFVPVADWLARHDVGSVKGSLHETALDNARGRLLTLGAGLFAAGALVFTARNFTVARRTLELTEQGQVTDRYTKAIEQLGSDKLDVRIGGIYALERVARDSARDHPTVMEVLTAFIREHSHEQWPPPDHPAAGDRNDQYGPTSRPPLPWSGAGILPATSGALTSPARTSPVADLAGANLDPRVPRRRGPRTARPPRRDLSGANLAPREPHRALTARPRRREPRRRGVLTAREPHRRQVARRRACSGRLETRPRLWPIWSGRALVLG